MYDYLESVKDDVREAIEENYFNRFEEFWSIEELENTLNEELWIDDSVTGNASGSYTFSAFEAEENLCHNLDLLKEAGDSFGCDMSTELAKGAEHCDILIRCYLLPQAISEVLEEYLNDFERAHLD